MDRPLNDRVSEFEAVLFASGEPLDVARIAEAMGVSQQAVRELAIALGNKYHEAGSALEVREMEDSYQLATRREFAPIIKRALEIRRNTPLSQAAMEVLAIIAYNQPVTRAFIEQVRGVDSSGVVQSLVDKQLVEEAGRLQLPGRPIAYGTTPNFLRAFGITELSELPELGGGEQPDGQHAEELPPPGESVEGQLGFTDS